MGTSDNNWKAVTKTKVFWEFHSESTIYAVTIPAKPAPNQPVTVRVTLRNLYGPVGDDTSVFVRIGAPDNPTDFEDLDSASDWVVAAIVEELVCVGVTEMLRSDAKEPFEEETPWSGTYDAELTFPEGRHSIEIKLASSQPEWFQPGVLSGWVLDVK